MTQPAPPAAGGGLTFPCKNCGAKLQFDAASQGMACPYCGHKEAVAPQGPAAPGAPQGAIQPAAPAQVREIPLEDGMRLAQRGLGAPVQTIQCKDCGATVHVGQGERTTECAFCGSKQVLPQQTNESAIRPESLLPFRVPKEDANKRFGTWLGALWFRPGDLKRIAKVQEMGGVYVPFWTFDARVRSDWQADRGYYYYETETYTAVENGQRVTRTRQVQRTRWEPASGWRQDSYDDTLVCAGKGLPTNLVQKFSTFDTKLLVPYRPEFLSGWRAESYAVDLMPAWGTAQEKMAGTQMGRCAGDVGGDTHRNLHVNNTFSNVTFKHVLLPIWIAAYRYNQKVYRFLVNGQTGEVVGDAPLSFWKIFFLVAAILALLGGAGAVYYFTQQPAQVPPAPAATVTATATATPPTATSTATSTTTATTTATAAPHPTPHPSTPHPGGTTTPKPPTSHH